MLYLELLKVIIFSGCLLSLAGLIIKSEFSFPKKKKEDDIPVKDVTENEKE